jgi:hypothetical protein
MRRVMLSGESSFDRPRCRREALLPLSAALAFVSRDPSWVGRGVGRLPQSGRIATVHSVNTNGSTAVQNIDDDDDDDLTTTRSM